MTDEKILMKKLDEMVLKGHGEELVYACSIAAGAAIVEIQRALLSLDEMQEVGIHYVYRTF